MDYAAEQARVHAMQQHQQMLQQQVELTALNEAPLLKSNVPGRAMPQLSCSALG